MKKILSICLVLMLAATTVMAEHVLSNKENPEFLYVLSAKSGSIEEGTLILKDVPTVVYFSDRPDRIAGHITLEKFVEIWKKAPVSLKADPPNAILSVLDKQGNKDTVVELIDLQLKGEILTYKVRVLEGNTPKSFGPSSLFIDAFPTAVNSQITD